MTVKQDAVTHQISERTLYMGRKLHRLGREDLVNAVMRGEIKLYRALQIADGKSNPTRLDKLFTAWRLCSVEDRAEFLRAIREASEE